MFLFCYFKQILVFIFCLQIFNCPAQAAGFSGIGDQLDDDYQNVDNFMNKPRKNVVSDIEPIGDELSNYPDRLYQRAKRTIVFRPLFVYRQEQIEKGAVETLRRLRNRRLNNERSESSQPPTHVHQRQQQHHHHHYQQDDRRAFDSY